MKTYCYSCGAKSEFSPKDKPKFCAKCGISFLDGSKRGGQENPAPAAGAYEEEEEDNVSIPTIDGLDYEFDDNSLSAKGEKLGAIMGTLENDQASVMPAANMPNMPKMTKDEAMEMFRKEAGAIRENPKKKDAKT